MYTIADDIERYRPVLLLSRVLSRRLMSILRNFLLIVALVCFIGSSGSFFFLSAELTSLLFGLSLIAFAFWIEQMMLYSYHNSFYFHGLNSVLGLSEEKLTGVTYEVAEALLRQPEDVTRAFITSQLGTVVLLRAGVDQNLLEEYLHSNRPRLGAATIPLPPDRLSTFTTLGQDILKLDPSFKNFLKQQGITDDTFIGALAWVTESYHQEKKLERWWGKDNLSKTKGVGREWSYGTPYLLEKFSRDIRTSAVFSTLTSKNNAFAEEKITEIEVALARAKAANVLVIGEAGVGTIDILLEVNRRLGKGASIGAVTDTRMVVLDTTRLFAVHKDKPELEATILNIFGEAREAGNIIIVIENLSTFIREAEALGVFVPELLDPFLASTDLHVVATDTPGAYHTFVEPLGAFSRRFAEVLIDAPNLRSTTKVLEGVALQNEARYRTLFTYASLVAITNAADRYLVEGVMPDKAIELLIDVATRAAAAGLGVVSPEYVYSVVSERTGIPVGPIGDGERELLLNLEEKLHKRVIGQQRALDAIARTMRRARAGIQSGDKPIGSFLFLGPTGVGKTETAKALAHIFFGSEKNMHRIDMSEFSGPDALSRLIGNGQESGVLPDMLREHPYAVLLLDEFEKGARAVHDIFLQILDEGMFTDARGDKVNARNTIVIATSNAGSQLILKTVAQRQELASLTEEIINHIVAEGVYRPELLNRFDSTIIFEPLTLEEQGQVAGLMLGSLYERIKERGYELTINRDLMDLLVKKGYNPQFGARPMQRVLQDLVEEKVAQQIISGAVSQGGTINLSINDFTPAELAL